MEYEELIKQIKRIKNKRIIVEGKKDKKALEALGLKKITLMNKPAWQIIEELHEKEVVLLVDLDREGRKIYSRLLQECVKHGIRVDNKLREYLFKKTTLRQIEGAYTYINKQRAD